MTAGMKPRFADGSRELETFWSRRRGVVKTVMNRPTETYTNRRRRTVLEKLTYPANVKISFNSSQCELIANHKEALTSKIPMMEYNCDLIRSHVVVFMNPKDLNITKLIVILKEFESPVSRDDIAQYYARGDERYVELINGTKLPMKMKLLYKVKVDQGGYIILKGSKEDFVNIKLIITYSDGHVKQFWNNYKY